LFTTTVGFFRRIFLIMCKKADEEGITIRDMVRDISIHKQEAMHGVWDGLRVGQDTQRVPE